MTSSDTRTGSQAAKAPTKPTVAPTMWDLLTGEDIDAAHEWFRWHPSEIDACLKARAASLPDPLTPAELDEILQAHVSWGADEASTANVARLADPKARVIVAGQQPGLLGGPLYSLYKALGAIGLAEKLGARYPDLNFIPVFWVASEDHDFAEIAEATWLSKEGSLTKLQVDHEGWAPGRMVGPLGCEAVRQEVLDLAASSTFDTDFKPQVMELLQRAYAPGRSWQDAFCEIVLELTRGLGLVVVSPLMSWVRQRGALILAAEARAAGQTSAAVLKRANDLKARGLTPTLHRHEDSINFFSLDQSGIRRPLRLDGNRVFATVAQDQEADGGSSTGTNIEPGTKQVIEFAPSTGALAEKVLASPEEFSFNVVSRPMVQDCVLPTVVQLVGPGEAAYFGQVEAAYETLGRFAAIRFPRPRVVLIAPNVERAMKKKNVTLDEALHDGLATIVDRHLAENGEDELGGELERLAGRQLEELNALGQNIGPEPGITKAIEKLSRSMERGYEGLSGRLRDTRRKANGDLELAVGKIQLALHPQGTPQERIFNALIPYCVNHGLDWARNLYPKLKIDGSGEIQPIYLSALGKSELK